MAAYSGHKMNPDKFEKGQIKIYLLVLPMVLLCGLPIVFIIFHAFKPMEELFAFPPKFITTHPTLDNFSKLIKASRTGSNPLSKYVFNSILVTVAVVAGSLLFSTMAAYALSKMKFKGARTMMNINQIALMFVSCAVMIPRYLVVNKLHMIDTYWAEILPLIALPVGLFLIKQFVDQVPDSLIEAAYMDGASEWTIYRKVVIPLTKPAIATAAILVFQQVWTNVETSNYYINDDSMKTLTFYMNSMINVNNTVAGQGMSAAATLILFIPNLVLFIILQNGVMNTMAHSGIK